MSASELSPSSTAWQCLKTRSASLEKPTCLLVVSTENHNTLKPSAAGAAPLTCTHRRRTRSAMERCPHWGCPQTVPASLRGTTDRCLPQSFLQDFYLFDRGVEQQVMCHEITQLPRAGGPSLPGMVATGLLHAKSSPWGCGATMPSLDIS